MRFAQYPQEEYLDIMKSYQGQYTVYKNPSSTDLKDLQKEGKELYSDFTGFVRGLVDLSKKNFYIFPAFADVHRNAYDRLVKARDISTPDSKILSFVGYIDNNKIYGQELNPLTGESLLPKETAFQWIKKYVYNMDEYVVDKYRTSGQFNRR